MEGTNWGCSWGYKVTILVGVISQLMKVKSPKLSTSMYKIYKMHIRVCLTIGHPKNHWFTIMSLLNGFNFGGILHFQTHSNLKWLVSHGFFKKYHMVILNVVLRKKRKSTAMNPQFLASLPIPKCFLASPMFGATGGLGHVLHRLPPPSRHGVGSQRPEGGSCATGGSSGDSSRVRSHSACFFFFFENDMW